MTQEELNRLNGSRAEFNFLLNNKKRAEDRFELNSL